MEDYKYSFTQMLQLIAPGEEASTINSLGEAVVVYLDTSRNLRYAHSHALVECSYEVLGLRWKLSRKKITALQAMERLINGKSAINVDGDVQRRFYGDQGSQAMLIYYLTNGEWYIPPDEE